ncbi:MAG: class I SAM-dependent methyltransferase [Chitinophagales bacterium]|nr:class I SAM-dependent methyltransferase [Chitinophagales bacterium]
MSFESFQNRVQKMYKHYHKWARRQQLSCYRIYDCDLPDFPLSIDIYGNCLYVCAYPKGDSDHQHTPAFWQSCLDIAAQATNIPIDNVFLKTRERQRGTSQYEKLADSQNTFIVQENGLQFYVNLSDYLDTGLFLDHRQTRQMVRTMTHGKRFLNLFAYTGSFSVYAAAGGATHTTTIDLSNTYLSWAKENMHLNGFTQAKHHYLQADILQWLAQPSGEQYDVVVLDPPTFSNSKRMADILDIQRDHVQLIQGCIDRLTAGGKLIFSTNFRRFRLQEAAFTGVDIKDISQQTLPPDFRDSRTHRCFLVGKQAT